MKKKNKKTKRHFHLLTVKNISSLYFLSWWEKCVIWEGVNLASVSEPLQPSLALTQSLNSLKYITKDLSYLYRTNTQNRMYYKASMENSQNGAKEKETKEKSRANQPNLNTNRHNHTPKYQMPPLTYTMLPNVFPCLHLSHAYELE